MKKEVKRQTNWMVIGGVVVLGIVIMGGLLALTLRNSETTEVVTLATFCESNPENCVFEGSAETAVTVVVQDQIPVSRHEAIKIKLEQVSPAVTEQTELNMLEWRLSLAAKETKTIVYEYAVEHPREMDVMGLH